MACRIVAAALVCSLLLVQHQYLANGLKEEPRLLIFIMLVSDKTDSQAELRREVSYGGGVGEVQLSQVAAIAVTVALSSHLTGSLHHLHLHAENWLVG
jgi:hypothetical protein